MITITDLRKVYHQGRREIIALDGVSLQVPKGSIHGIIGHSGAGKSTLVRCLSLLDRPSSGSVIVDGVELSSVGPREIRQARRRIGMVFQQANLLDSRTAAGNVAHPLEIAGTPKDQIAATVDRLLTLVGLAELAKAYPAQLSGGQQQRVGIARALASNPDVLLCDEPTSALDPATTEEILDLIKDLSLRLQLTVLIITHEMNVVKRICTAVSLLESGRIIEDGSLADIAEHADSRLAQALLPLPSLPTTGPRQADADQVVSGTAVSGASSSAALDSRTVLDLTFGPDSAGQPVLSGLVRHFDIDVNVLSGSIESIGSEQFGRLQVALDSGTDSAAVVHYLEDSGVSVSFPATTQNPDPSSTESQTGTGRHSTGGEQA